ncbi:secreted protein [gut metagenome]|uniref:Secreted protein n=1 Tax=gut metagenome TaxID=749906 RepID=J9GJ09_9ZZZZ
MASRKKTSRMNLLSSKTSALTASPRLKCPWLSKMLSASKSLTPNRITSVLFSRLSTTSRTQSTTSNAVVG